MTPPRPHHIPPPTVYGRIGFLLLGIFSLLYSMFWREFAQTRIQFSFLNFPVFVGEILLLVCFILAAAQLSKSPGVLRRSHVWILIYGVWLLAAAFYGYRTHGPLAFRTAALFYYPFFFVFGYIFYSRNLLTQQVLYGLALLFLYLQAGAIWGYFRLEYLILAVIVSLYIKNKKIRYSYLFLLVWLFPYKEFLVGSKTHLLGFIAAVVFLLFFVTYILLEIKKRHRLSIFVAVILILITGICCFGRKEKTQVLLHFNLGRAMEDYRQMEAFIAERRGAFHFQEINPQLYSQDTIDFSDWLSGFQAIRTRHNKEKAFFYFNEAVLESGTITIKDRLNKEFKGRLSNMNFVDPRSMSDQYGQIVEEIFRPAEEEIRQLAKKVHLASLEKNSFTEQEFSEMYQNIDVILKAAIQKANEAGNYLLSTGNRELTRPMEFSLDVLQGSELQGLVYIEDEKRAVGREYSNILFRVHIWRDMIEEVVEQKAWWGINFGKPQRSKRIEILQAARAEWTRDGWITPHNSYLHIIYRAGVVGLVLIVVLLVVVVRMISKFIALKSLTGILLSSIIIYWLTIANFGVILEFPYNAIPFWSLFGMAYAYLHQLENKKLI